MITISNPSSYNAALYVRLSNERIEEIINTDVSLNSVDAERESGSITNQKRFLTSFCEESGITNYKIYSDDGYSGANFERPGFKKMLKDIESGNINLVVVKDLSRFGRVSSKVTYYTDEYFPEHKVRFVAVSDAIDTGIQSNSEDITQFRAFFNEWFLRDCSKKVKNGKRTKGKAGKVMTTYATYGYKKDPKDKNHYIIDEEIAPIVKEIFSLGKDGKTPTEIARIMTQKGYKVPSEVVGNVHTRTLDEVKRGWNRNAVKRILVNKVYLGHVINGKLKKVNYKSKKILSIPEDEWCIVENMHEPIIDQRTYDIVQNFIKNRTRTRKKKYDYILRGMIECEECGKKLGVVAQERKDGSLRFYLKCNTYSTNTALNLCTPHCCNLQKVTALILESIRKTCCDYLKEEEFTDIASKTKINNDNKKLKEKEINILNNKLVFLNKKINTLYDDKINNLINVKDFERLYNDTNNEIKNINNRIKELKQETKNNNTSKEKSINTIKKFVEMNEANKIVLLELIDRITISEKKEIKIYYKLNELNDFSSNRINMKKAV